MIKMQFNIYLPAGIIFLLILKICHCAEFVIKFPGNLSPGSIYRFDYSPPQGYPPPNSTIAAEELAVNKIFSQAIPGTEYEFSLFYSNSTLNNWLISIIIFITAPDPPSNISAVAQDGNSALISWSPPLQGHYSTYLLKVVSLSAENASTSILHVDDDTYQYNLGDLKPGTRYQIQAFTILYSKKSDTYASINFTTKPNTPGKFIVWFRNETTLLVLWQPPYPAGIFTDYKVSIDPPDANESLIWVEKDGDPPGPAQAAFKGLVPGRAYKISIQTMSYNEYSTPAIAQYHTIPLRPLNVTIERINSTTVRVRWEPPRGLSEFDNYEVSMGTVRRAVPVTIARNKPTLWYFYDNFTLLRKYTVNVKTVSGNVTSWPASKEITFQPTGKGSACYTTPFEILDNDLLKISRYMFIYNNVKHIDQILLAFKKIIFVEETAFWDTINLKELILSHNNISTLQSNTFVRLRCLERLWLDSNNLEVLATNLFANLTSLELLNLKKNKIRELDQNLFLSVNKLEVLILSGNMIKLPHKNIFSNLTTLRYIDLGFNQISYLVVGIFQNNPLETLSIIGNRLTVIEDHIFNSLKFLSSLDVSKNRVQELKNTTFNKLVFLKMLVLSHNNITAIEKGTFDKLQKLESLNLGWNNLSGLPNDLFKGLNSMTTLHLGNNKISHITDVFPKSLTELHLDYNNLSTLNPSILMNLENLTEVSLENNPWFCDCRLGELYDYPVLNENLTCAEPQQFKNRSWKTLTPNLFACKPSVLIMISNMSGNNVQLSCKVIGSPEPRIQWVYKNDTTMEIIDSKNVDFQKYFALDMDESYEYNFITWLNISVPKLIAYSHEYFCRATNSEGLTEERAMYNFQIETVMLSLNMQIFIGLSITVLIILFLLLLRRILLYRYVTTFT